MGMRKVYERALEPQNSHVLPPYDPGEGNKWTTAYSAIILLWLMEVDGSMHNAKKQTIVAIVAQSSGDSIPYDQTERACVLGYT